LVRAMDHVSMGRKQDFYQAARSILVHRKSDLPLFDEAFEVFWRRPAVGYSTRDLRSMGVERFADNFFYSHMVGRVIEGMVMLMAIVCGGVLERYPGLKVVLLEGGASHMPWWVSRMDEHYEWRYPLGDMQHLKLKPSEYFNRQGYVAVEVDEKFVSHVVEAVGDDRIVTTSDYPHGDAKFPNAMDTFMDLPLSDSSKNKILWENPKRLYGI